MQFISSLLTQLQRIKATWQKHGLFYLTLFLLVFIPLYPKIPLFEAIPGYLVRVRLEDLFVFAAVVWWLVKVIRGHLQWQSSFLWLMLMYASAGLLSLLSALFLLQSVPLELLHFGKSLLHFLRYLEYFSLFVLFFSSLKERWQVKWVVIALGSVVAVASLYGFGQKNWHWPLFSTMNREFSKGQTLYLTEHARVQSTFAGHYDLAAYLVLILPLLFSVMLRLKNRGWQLILAGLNVAGLWLLSASASKIALMAYAVGMASAVFLNLSFKNWWQRFLAWVGGGLVSAGLLLVLLYFTSPSVLRSLVEVGQALSFISQQPKFQQLLTQAEGYLPPEPEPIQVNGDSVDDGFKQTGPKPSDVYVDVPDYVKVATISANGEQSFRLEERQRVWSENALKYGLSMGIRLDTLWPQAIKGFLSQPYLGKGYATLNKTASNEFLEADSTDNNYLRVLGETGLLGFILFYGLILLLIKRAWWQQRQTQDPLLAGVSAGFVAASFGLLTNALIIDVFTASKVAFSFWALAGIVSKIGFLDQKLELEAQDQRLRKKFTAWLKKHWSLLLIASLFLFLTYKQPLAQTGPLLTFQHSQQQVEPVLQAKCWLRQVKTELCPLNLSWAEQIYAGYLMPFYWLLPALSTYFLANFILIVLSFSLTWHLLKRLLPPTWSQLALLIFALLPPIYLLPAGLNFWNLGLPLILLLLNWLQAHFQFILKPKLQLRPWWWLILVLVITPYWWQQSQNNFRAQPPTWAYQMLQRADRMFKLQDPAQPAPIISAIGNQYRVLVGHDHYRFLTLSNQEMATYQDLITHKQPLFLNNLYADRTTDNQQAFQQIKDQFGIKLIEIDCQHECNFYQLLAEQPPLATEPVSINQRHLTAKASQQPLKFIIYNQRYLATHSAQPNNSQTVMGRLSNFRQIADQKPDFLIIGGDVVHKPEAVYVRYFQKVFGQQVEFPITYLAGNYDQDTKKAFSSPTQTFTIGQNMFILYQPTASESRVTAGMEKQIFNAFLWLEKHPEVKNVFIITQRPNWLAENQPYSEQLSSQVYSQLNDFDLFFKQTLLPKLNSLQQEVYVMSGDLKPQAEESYYYQQDETNPRLHYLLSNAHGLKSDVFVEVVVSEQGEVLLKQRALNY